MHLDTETAAKILKSAEQCNLVDEEATRRVVELMQEAHEARKRIAELDAALCDLVMLERITTPDMSGKRRTWAHMQNGTILADALDKARDVLAKTI
jgi:hypothetical protein